ncbi:MAG: N-formylglutamate amidohydrolase, partial [Bacteroidaceae bacterium]|nr:N-formylglutamate amidohydrolase [Bacteroidaceae bacterium]
DHQDNLRSALNEDSVLIDCRTFPSDMADCDICIGYNDDSSYDKDIVDGVIGIFKDRGYKVSVNEPYSNFIVPRTAFDYPAIMIGVNKRVYLNERILQLERDNKKWIRWNGTLEKINDFLRKR